MGERGPPQVPPLLLLLLWELSLDHFHGGPERRLVLPARGKQRLDLRRALRGNVELPLPRGDHEDDLALLHARPRKLARVDLPDDHAEAVQREKDVIELVAAQVTPKNQAYALTYDNAGRVHHLYTSAMNAAPPTDAFPMSTWSRAERFSVENYLLSASEFERFRV